jgi:hypothetical protein
VLGRTIVEENNLAVQISVLRKVFHESGKTPRFIVTVPGRISVCRRREEWLFGPDRSASIANGSGDQRSSSPNGTVPDVLEDPSEHNSWFTRSSGRSRKWAIIAAVLAAGGILLYIAFRQGTFGNPLAADNNQPRIRQLTTKGRVALAAISRNGEFYVYTTDVVGERKRGLWIAQIKGGKNIELRPPMTT